LPHQQHSSHAINKNPVILPYHRHPIHHHKLPSVRSAPSPGVQPCHKRPSGQLVYNQGNRSR
jgi:hypothetical protein